MFKLQNLSILILLLILLLLIGCAPTVYTHPTKNAQDFERDKYDCEKIAEQSAANWGSRGNLFIIADEMKRCLELKFGWTPVRR